MTVRKQVTDLTLSYTTDIGIPGIVEGEIIPKDQTVLFDHAKHFASEHFFHPHIENRRKDRKLKDKIEAGVTERELRSIAAVNLHSLRA
jgi:hypothetical protein